MPGDHVSDDAYTADAWGTSSRTRPSVILFDVNETLSDMAPVAERFVDVGAPAALAQAWFASLLRDGFALAAVGMNVPFAEVAVGQLRAVLSSEPLDRSIDEAIRHVMDGFRALPVHPDVADGIRGLAAAGPRLVTLSNGAVSVAEELLTQAGVRDCFEALLSVEDAPHWKPAASAYEYAIGRCGIQPRDALLVAVHPWDIAGAARAGLATAWINRRGVSYPDYFTRPNLISRSLTDLADQLSD